MQVRVCTEGVVLTGELERYASQKAAQLLKPLSKSLRATARCTIEFMQGKNEAQKTCRFLLQLDDIELVAEESTQHLYAALDIAVVQLEQQLYDLAARDRTFARRLRRALGAEWRVP